MMMNAKNSLKLILPPSSLSTTCNQKYTDGGGGGGGRLNIHMGLGAGRCKVIVVVVVVVMKTAMVTVTVIMTVPSPSPLPSHHRLHYLQDFNDVVVCQSEAHEFLA